jgi:adenylate cyclase
MSEHDKSEAIWAIPLAVLVAACLFVLGDPGGFSSDLRNLEFDAYQHAQPRPYEDVGDRDGHPVKIVDVDAASLERFGPWPWSRFTLARLTDDLKKAGAAVVVLDLDISGADPVAPTRLGASLPPGAPFDSLRAQLGAVPAPDTALAKSLAGLPAVAGFALGETGNAPRLKADIAMSGAGAAVAGIPDFSSASGPAPEIAAAGAGALNLPADPDGRVRGVPFVLRWSGKPVPSLDAEALRLVTGAQALSVATGDEGLPNLATRTVVQSAQAGATDVVLAQDGHLAIRFSGHRPERFVSAAAIDSGSLPQESLKGAVVYIGDPQNVVRTPFGRMSDAEIHAEALENMLLHAALKPVTTIEAVLGFLIITGAGMLFLLARRRIASAGILALVAIAAAQLLAWVLFSNAHMLLDAANPSAALALAGLAGIAIRGLEISRSRARLKLTFADSLPDKVIHAVARRPALLRLSGSSRTVTCVSCGIRGFAGIAESFADDPAGFTRVVNMAIGPLIEVALAHRGMIARFDCEGFLAAWNAPLDDAEHAIHACEAANRMTAMLAEVNEQLSRERRLDGTTFPSLEIGIGISTGAAIAGGFTAHGRTIYSVTGDAALQADRIRDLSQQYGPAVVASEDARKAAQRGYAFLEVDYIAAGPRDEPVKLYAMLGNPLVRASPKFRALETFHEHIFQSVRLQQWDKARGLIEQCRQLSGASPKIYDLHLARIAWFEANPPGADWDGAFRPILR